MYCSTPYIQIILSSDNDGLKCTRTSELLMSCTEYHFINVVHLVTQFVTSLNRIKNRIFVILPLISIDISQMTSQT